MLAVPAGLVVDNGSTGATVGGIVMLAVAVYLASFSVVYVTVVLAGAAGQVMRGQGPYLSASGASPVAASAGSPHGAGVGSGLRGAHRPARPGWGCRRHRPRGGAQIWSLVTFLVVPVLAFEGIGPFAAMKRPTTLFRQRWGPHVTGDIVIGGEPGLVVLAGLVVCVVGAVTLAEGGTGAEVAGGLLILVGVIMCVAGAVFGGATRGVFGIALYRYVAEDRTLEPFNVADFACGLAGRTVIITSHCHVGYRRRREQLSGRGA